jgi:hypothetical protein
MTPNRDPRKSWLDLDLDNTPSSSHHCITTITITITT